MRVTAVRWRGRAVAVLIAVFVIEAVTTTSQLALAPGAPRTAAYAWAIFKTNLWRAGVWAALTPAVFDLARRYRLDRRPWWPSLLVMIGASLGFALLHVTLTTLWFLPELAPAHGGILGSLRYMSGYAMNEVVMVWAIVGGYYIVDYARALRDSRVVTAELAARAARLEASTAEARLEAMRMELQPHFLFNALNAVSGLVRGGDNDRAVDVLTRLGDLLRRAFARDAGNETTVADELESVREYLDVELARFGDRLDVSVVAQPGIDERRVPTFVLQPLVENAVKHGVARSTGRCRIDVRAREEQGSLVLTVENDGAPLRPHAPEGIGLSNTRRRLSELYGDRARLTVAPRPGGGALATVRWTVRA